MNNSHEEEDESASSSSSLNRLPDELILQILTKLPDLKTLCLFHLVSKRFSSLVLQIHTISFIAPLINPNNSITNTSGFWSVLNGVVFKPLHLLKRMLVPSSKPLPAIISSFYGDSFRSALLFLCRFNAVKSLTIELPCSNHDSNCLFKWKVKFGNRIESFIYLSPNSVCDINGLNDSDNDNDNDNVDMELSADVFKQKVHVAFQCLKDVIMRHRMLLYFVKDFPDLENLSITDSEKRGTLCLSGGKVDELRGWFDDVITEMDRIEVPVNVSQCYVPVMNLPVSGCVMKGVSCVVMLMSDGIQDGNDGWMNGEDEVEDAYSEAVMEILKNYRDKMKRLL